MSHVLHTVIVSYNRLELLKRTLASYLDTVTLPYELLVFDNGSGPGLQIWLGAERRRLLAIPNGPRITTVIQGKNLYPGGASNRGFHVARPEATLLHRSDNDMEYKSGWCDEVVARFQDPKLGQLGLRTLEEEGPHAAVGGTMVVRRELWDRGLRYSEAPWSPSAPFEDSHLSQDVYLMGYRWERASVPCVEHIGIASSTDPYYQQTFRERGITFAAYGIE